MTTHDDDILDFDFFDEGATRETPAREGGGRRPPPPSGPRGPRLRAGLTPLLRLVGLIAFAILVVVLVVVWAQGCAGDRKRDAYDTYMTGIGGVGADSAKIGTELGELLTTPGLKQDELETRLAGLVQQQRIGVTRAQELDPPGPVFPQHEQALEALQFRATGMQGLLSVFQATKASNDSATAGQQLSTQGQRLITSDVVWDDLFRKTSEGVLSDRSIDGVAVPDSNFVENSELYTARSLAAIHQRIHGASTGGTPSGLHGNSLAFVRAQPSAQQLSPTTETTVELSTDLSFEVAATNTGDFQEVSVEVTLTIPVQPAPIVKKQTIDLIDPGETKTVTFRDFGDVTPGDTVKLQVAVKPVPGETRRTNNSAEYPVIFSLPEP